MLQMHQTNGYNILLLQTIGASSIFILFVPE